MTIIEFLLARIEQDESFALSAQAAASTYDEGSVRWHWLRTDGSSRMWEPTLSTPARVLAECEAKRRIVGDHVMDEGFCVMCKWEDPRGCPTLRHIASVYADHPDYQREWRADA